MLIYFYTICNIFLCTLLVLTTLRNHSSVTQKETITIFTGKIMGTYWQVKIPNLENKKYIQDIIKKCLHKDEEMLSSWKTHSIVSRFNKLKKNQLQRINKNFYHIILSALNTYKKTNGKLDITISPLIDIWGFGVNKKPHYYPSIKKIKKNILHTGSQHLKIIKNSCGIYLKKDMNSIKINLSTLGEGFATDHISYILKKQGIKNYTISVGGTVCVKIEKYKNQSKIIAIQKPIDHQQSIHLLIRLKNASISTAGTYRNYYYLQGKRISHLIDPTTGKPIRHHLVSVSVISSTALEADSWDTGLLILGFKKAQKLALKERLAVCLITKDQKISTWLSPEFKKYLFKQK